MKFEINIEKKHLYYLVGLLVFVFITAIAIAQTSAPNPGHAATEIGEGTIAGTLTISNGNVGIGTASPSHKLNVVGSANITGNIYTESTSFFGNGVPANIYNYFNTDSREWIVGVGQSGGDDKFLIQDSTASATRFLIDTAGNVGIGTTSPVSPFHVSVNNPSWAARIDNVANPGSGLVIEAGSVASDYSFAVNNGASSVTYFVVNGLGNVGIGTTSPGAKLDVDGIIRSIGNEIDVKGTSPRITGINTVGTTQFNIGYALTTVDVLDIQAVNSNKIKFSTTATDGAMTILNGGNVGIGTTSPDYKLHVDTKGNGYIGIDYGTNQYGGIAFRENGIPSGYIQLNDISTTDRLEFFVGGGTDADRKMVIQDNGYVGIGTTSPGATLDVNGNIKTSSLAGIGNAYACVNADGQLYRSPTACS